MKDDLFLTTSPIRLCNLLIAMFCYYLGAGHTIYCKNIKSGTVYRYAKDAADGTKYINSNDRDIRYASPNDKRIAPEISAVLDELSRYEKVPDRQEATTIPMQQESRRRAQQIGPHGFLWLEVAMADWDEALLYIGARLSEWAQKNRSHRHPNNFMIREDRVNEASAFTLGDFSFSDSRGRTIRRPAALANPESVYSIAITFRWQKNKQHGEQKRYARNTTPGGICCVSALLRILRRFVTLFGADDLRTPVAAYLDRRTNRPQLITSVEINAHLRSLAEVVYDLDPTNDEDRLALSKWTSHSYRIGACVILHSLGYDATTIQFLLRWRSLAFTAYLRSTITLAERQAQDFNRAVILFNNNDT